MLTQVLKEMTQLYTRFCLPQLVINRETGEIISLEGKWQNTDAEKLYNTLSEIYVLLRDGEYFIYMV